MELPNIPDNFRTALDTVEQAMGEILFLRAVLDSIKAENPPLVARHAKAVQKDLSGGIIN